MTYDAEPVIETNRESYGWAECRADLEEGVDPKCVAERMGEPVDFIREVAEQQGWPITFREYPPPQDNAHVAPGCERFPEPSDS